MHARSHGFEPEELLAHTRWLRALARTLVGDAAAADDLVQDTFVVALERDTRPGNLRKWCAGVLRNLARRRRRDAGRRERREGAASRTETGGAGSGEALARADLLRRLIERVFELDEPYRTTIVLRFFEELSLEEIAEREGCPSSTVRTRLARGLERLRERLDAEHGGDRAAWSALFVPLALRASEAGAATTTAIGWGGLGMGLKARFAVVAAVVAAGAFVWRGAGMGMGGAEPGRDTTPAVAPVGASGPGADAGSNADTASLDARSVDERRPVAAPTPAAPGIGVLVYGSVLGDDGTRIEQGAIALVGADGAVEDASIGAPGTFSLLAVRTGSYRLVAECTGYLDHVAALAIPADAETVRRDLRLTPALTIPVRFVDEAGHRFTRPAPASALFHLAVVATLDPPPRTLPGADGRAYERNAIGRYQGRSAYGSPIAGLGPEHDGLLSLRVAPPVWVSAVLRGTVLESRRVDGPVEELVFRIAAADGQARLGGVRLRVVDALSGEALPGARVALNYRDAGTAGTAAGADGSAERLDEMPGLRRLEVHAQGHASLHRWVRIEPGLVLELGDVALAAPATLAGRIVSDEGEGVSASFTWIPIDGIGMAQDVETNLVARSAMDGSFRIEAAVGRVALVATDSEWASSFVIVDASSAGVDGVELRLTRGVEVRFRPTDSGLEGARFTLATAAGLPFLSQRIWSSLPFARRLAPGEYQMWLGWDERVLERRAFTVAGAELGPSVVDLPALEPPR